MNILAIDTSGTSASAALMDEHMVFAESSVTLADLRFKDRKTHSETLMPMIEGLFEVSGMAMGAVDCIACTCGPGSFTGLRIGAATAKGLAFALGKPLIAVPTLDALAYNVAGINTSKTWVIPMLDARRGQAYSAFYYMGEERRTDYLAEPVDDLLKMLKNLISKDSHIIFLGEGARAYAGQVGQEVWPKDVTIAIAPARLNRVQAASVGACAFNKQWPHEDESGFTLLYIRKPQAQREREKRLACFK